MIYITTEFENQLIFEDHKTTEQEQKSKIKVTFDIFDRSVLGVKT